MRNPMRIVDCLALALGREGAVTARSSTDGAAEIRLDREERICERAVSVERG